MADLADEQRLLTPAAIGTVVADHHPGPRMAQGDPQTSLLQRVKHLWRLAYMTGLDAEPWVVTP
jgi:hypothetical protein